MDARYRKLSHGLRGKKRIKFVFIGVICGLMGLATAYAVKWYHGFYHHVTPEELSHEVKHSAFQATIRSGPALIFNSTNRNMRRINHSFCSRAATEVGARFVLTLPRISQRREILRARKNPFPPNNLRVTTTQSHAHPSRKQASMVKRLWFWQGGPSAPGTA